MSNEKLGIGSYVRVNKRGKNYLYSREGSEGRIIGFADDEVSNEKVAVVRFYKLTKTFTEEKNPEWPTYLSSLFAVKRNNKGRLINGKRHHLCEDCGTEHCKANLEKIHGYWVCKNCLKNYEKCSNCKELPLKNMGKYSSKKDFYCKECYNKTFTTCVKCSKEKKLKDTKKGLEGKDYCKTCYDQSFQNCQGCEDLFWKRDLRHDTRRNLYFCNSCFEAEKTIKSYNYMPRKLNYNKNPWENGLMMGVELEIQVRDSAKKAEDLKDFLSLEKLYDNFYFKDDGSLRDENGVYSGFEIVSHPCSLQHMHKNIKWKYILKWLLDNEFISYHTGKCGIHVHLSRNFFTDKEVRKMRIFHNVNYEKIYSFSKRGSSGNSYCASEVFHKEEYIHNTSRGGGGGRRCCVNVDTNKPTIELRIFRGTLKYDRFLATLQFCDAISHYVKEVSAVYLLKQKSWTGFKEWSSKQHRYEHMIKYFNTHAL